MNEQRLNDFLNKMFLIVIIEHLQIFKQSNQQFWNTQCV